MKSVDIGSPIGLDRLATWNEVRCAMSFSFQDAFRLVGARDDFHDMDSGFSGRAGTLPEDIVWLAIASGMLDSSSN